MIRRWYFLPVTVPLLALMVACSIAGAPFRLVWWGSDQLMEHLASNRCWDSWDRPQWRRLLFGTWY